VDVEVRPTAKPVVLVLTAYSETVWNVRPAAGARLKAVVVGGYFAQEVDGVPAGVPVHHYCPDPSSHFEGRSSPPKGTFYAYQWNTSESRRLAQTLNDATGLLISSFQAEPRGTAFVVDGVRGGEFAQKERRVKPPLPKPVPAEELRAAAAGADLHLVSIYQTGTGTGTPVDVEVRATGKPVVLALASYMEALWKVKVADGVKLKAVIIGGYFEQEFEGVPAGVPVAYCPFFPARAAGYFYASKPDTKEYANALQRLDAMTGLRPATVQLTESGTAFVVDGTRGRELARQEPKKEDAAPAKEPPKEEGDPLADVADIPSQEFKAGGDADKRYFLVGPRKDAKAPADGYGLVVVMPGGDGSADFNPFVRRIVKNALPERYVVAQPVARKWTSDQEIVWPTKTNPVAEMKFGTEEFVAAVIDDVAKRHALDRGKVFTLSWSSSGPAAYAASLQDKRAVTGSLVAMSVFNPTYLPPLTGAKGHAYYLYHSPQDRVCPYRMAEQARTDLTANGATVRLEAYQGGHGWRGNLYADIRTGVEWLEKNCEKAGKP
jgi:predicted esterase